MPTYKNDSSEYRAVIDTDGVRQDVGPGASIQTYTILSGTGWTKTADTPYYNIVADDPHAITFAAAEWKEQVVDPDNHVLEITTSVKITVHANSASAKGYQIAANETRQIRHNGNIEKLYLHSAAAGEATVQEIED